MSHEDDGSSVTPECKSIRIGVSANRFSELFIRLDPRFNREALAEFFEELPPILVKLEHAPRLVTGQQEGVVIPFPRRAFGIDLAASSLPPPLQGMSRNGKIDWEIQQLEAGSARIRLTLRARVPGLLGVWLRVLLNGQPITGISESPDLVFERGDPLSDQWLVTRELDLTRIFKDRTLPPEVKLTLRMTGNRSLGVPGSVLRTCCFADGGVTLLTGGNDGHLAIWDLTEGAVQSLLEGHQGPIRACAVDASSRIAVTASADHSLRVWDLVQGNCSFVLEGHESEVTAIALSSDGTLVVSGSSDGLLLIWSLDNVACIGRLVGHSDEIVAVVLAPDASRLVSASKDETLRVWDMRTLECRRISKLDGDGVSSLAISPDGEIAVTGSRMNTLQVWQLDSGEYPQRLSGHAEANIAVAFALDGNHVVSGSQDGTICVWRIDQGDILLHQVAPAGIQSMALLAEGLQVAAVLNDGSLWFWESLAAMLASATVSPPIAAALSAVAASERTPTNKFKRGRVWATTVGAVAAAACLVLATTSWSDLTRFFVTDADVQEKGSGAVHGNMYCKLPSADERVMVGRFAVCPPRTAMRVRAASPPGKWAQLSFIACDEHARCAVSYSQSIGGRSEVTFPLAAATSNGNFFGWLVWSDKPLEGSAVQGASRELRRRAAQQRGVGDAQSLCRLLGTPCALFPFSWEVANRDPDE